MNNDEDTDRGLWAQLQPYLNGNCGMNFAP